MKFYSIREEYLAGWTKDPEFTSETVIGEDVVSRMAHEWGVDVDELIENQLVEVYHPWYAVEMDENDNDWGTGSYDYGKAVLKAHEMGARFIAVIDERGDCVCDRVIDLCD